MAAYQDFARKIGRQQAAFDAYSFEKNAFVPGWMIPLLGTAAGVGAYGLSRIPKLVSRARFPALRKLQDLSRGEAAFHWAATPAEIAEGALGGPRAIWGHRGMPKTLSGEPAPKLVFSGYKRHLPKGVVNPALGPVTGKAHRRAYDLAHVLENKERQLRLARKHAPELFPETITIKELRRKYKLPLRRGKHLEEDIRRIQEAAQRHLKGKAIIKPSAPRRGGDVGAASMGAFPSTSTNLSPLERQWRTVGKEYRKAQQSGDFIGVQRKYTAKPAYKGRVVDEMFHDNVIFQKMVPKATMPSGVPHEYRVHTVGGRVVPNMTESWEYGQGVRDTISQMIMKRRAARWVQKQIDQLPEKYRNISMGVDVVPLQGGGFRAFELNPGGQSGFLDFPGAPEKLVEAITGRATKEVARRRALNVGIGTAGGLSAASLSQLPWKKQDSSTPRS